MGGSNRITVMNWPAYTLKTDTGLETWVEQVAVADTTETLVVLSLSDYRHYSCQITTLNDMNVEIYHSDNSDADDTALTGWVLDTDLGVAGLMTTVNELIDGTDTQYDRILIRSVATAAGADLTIQGNRSN